jgi:multidrug resistance efflux pump
LNGETSEIKDQNQTPVPEDAEKEKPVDGNQEMVQTAVTELQERVAALEGQVESKTGVITGLEERLAGLSHDLEGAKAAYSYAVEDYKRLAAGANPLVPAEAISGATIEEVKDSLDRALKLVDKIKTQMQIKSESETESSKVPAGAPARTGLDTSAMSTKEKINYGLEQARKKKE